MYLNRQKYQQQQGFVLIMVLVLLTVMTLIGVSSMNSSNMELKATANAKQHQIAFNGAQSLIEFAVSANTTLDFQTDSLVTQNISTVVAGTSALSAAANFAGCTIGVGSSMQKNKSFSYNFYNITGSGYNSTGTATSIQTQGVRYPAAACN